MFKDIECDIANCNYRFALTGQTWQVMREYYPDIMDHVCIRSAIFARMNSDQKQQLVMELIRLGYYVGMCISKISRKRRIKYINNKKVPNVTNVKECIYARARTSHTHRIY